MSAENPHTPENSPQAIPLGPVTNPEQKGAVPISSEAAFAIASLEEALKAVVWDQAVKEEARQKTRFTDMHAGREYPDAQDVVDGSYTMPTGHHHHMTRRERKHTQKLADAQRKQNYEAHKLAHLRRGESFLSAKRRKVELTHYDILQEKAHLRAERSRGDITKAEYKAQMKNLRNKSHTHYAHLVLPVGTEVRETYPSKTIDIAERRLAKQNRRVVKLGGTALQVKPTKVTVLHKKGHPEEGKPWYEATRTTVEPRAA